MELIDTRRKAKTVMELALNLIVIIINLLMSPLLGHKPSLLIHHQPINASTAGAQAY
jgi:hypothetical protein